MPQTLLANQSRMTRYEYQIVELTLEKVPSRHIELVKVLNRFGQEGWRLHEYQLEPVRATNERHIRLLLERELPDDV